MPLPTDLIFDSGMFPSLPPPGGKMSHAELMGRQQQRIITPAARAPGPGPSQPSRGASGSGTSASLDGHGPRVPSRAPAHAPRPGMGLRRVSSFSGSASGSGNRAGVGAVYNDLPARSLPTRNTGRRGSIIGPTPPPPVRRTSSHDEAETTPTERSVNGHNASTPRARPPLGQHQRTASDSTISISTITRPSAAIAGSSTKTQREQEHDQSPADGSVRLGRPDQSLEIGRLIGTLHALTPPSRVRLTPVAQTTVLHPSFILTPFAVCLEALVSERAILTSPGTPPPHGSSNLPTLADGTSFHLSSTGAGSGELDWTVLQTYTHKLGTVLDQLLPYINSTPDQFALEDLVRSIRMFVGKIKKVFSEVVQGYGDQYGFMKGWWDDKSMKGCAGEIGRWCDLFDA